MYKQPLLLEQRSLPFLISFYIPWIAFRPVKLGLDTIFSGWFDLINCNIDCDIVLWHDTSILWFSSFAFSFIAKYRYIFYFTCRSHGGANFEVPENKSVKTVFTFLLCTDNRWDVEGLLELVIPHLFQCNWGLYRIHRNYGKIHYWILCACVCPLLYFQ